MTEHECKKQYRGIRVENGKTVEAWYCPRCKIERLTPYSGTQDTIEERV